AVEGAAAPRPAGVRVLYAVIAGGADLPPFMGGRYRLHLRGTGVADAWVADVALPGALSAPGFLGPYADHVDTVVIPATSESVVAVGAIAVAPDVSVDAGPLTYDGALPGLPAPFSARGPRRDALAKPDLAAPGAWVVAAL